MQLLDARLQRRDVGERQRARGVADEADLLAARVDERELPLGTDDRERQSRKARAGAHIRDRGAGEVRVDRITAAHDCGKAINPINVEGQVIGSVWMGLGQAVQEEMLWENGRLMNAGLLEYRSASTLESPPIDPIIVESNDPEGPFGAKEAGEGSLAATIPAVAHAIFDAVGVWINSLPITPEKILKALEEKKKSEVRSYESELRRK